MIKPLRILALAFAFVYLIPQRWRKRRQGVVSWQEMLGKTDDGTYYVPAKETEEKHERS